METIAIYSPKGGVGKTTLAVNLAWAAATLSSRRTLLWDLDAQGAASFVLGAEPAAGDDARAVIERRIEPARAVRPTATPGLDLLPADASLRALDPLFAAIDAKKRLAKLVAALGRGYDRLVIDCPPGLGPTAEQVIRAASLIVMPVIPSALAMRAGEELAAHLGDRRKGAPPVLPVFNMVDRRRAAHRAALAAEPDRPAIPASAHVEQMAERRLPLGRSIATHSAATARAAGALGA